MIFKYEELKLRYKGLIEMTTHLSQSYLVDHELAQCDGFIGCQAGIGQGCIGPTGDVSPCVMLPVKVGNIKDAVFAEIWKTSRLINSLKARNEIKGPCASCKFINKCGGCRAVAFSYTGDVMESDQRCWLIN
jgi:AdoMet-dependent heme synthase